LLLKDGELVHVKIAHVRDKIILGYTGFITIIAVNGNVTNVLNFFIIFFVIMKKLTTYIRKWTSIAF
jgi:hypothetical protein